MTYRATETVRDNSDHKTDEPQSRRPSGAALVRFVADWVGAVLDPSSDQFYS